MLEDGNVVPFINFQPAQATDVIPEVVLREIDYAEPAPPAGPPTPAP